VFHVVLFEPEIPGNTGNSIRLCANTGATLHLIKPLGFGLDDKNLKRSGLDYHDLADLKIHANLNACLAQLADSRLFVVETGGARCYSDVRYRAGDAFLFGPETRGLPQDAQRILPLNAAGTGTADATWGSRASCGSGWPLYTMTS